MKYIFNRKLYKESMRRMLGIALLSALLVLVCTIVYCRSIDVEFYANLIFPLYLSFKMIAIYVALSFFLIIAILGYGHDRCQSDFYDSIPYKRKTMLFTSLVAYFTYFLITFVIIIAVGISLTLTLKSNFFVPIWDDFFMFIVLVISAMLLVVSITVLSISLNGKNSTAFITALIIAFLPRAIIDTLMYDISSNVTVETFSPLLNKCINSIYLVFAVAISPENVTGLNLWYPIIYSMLLSIIYFVLGYHFFMRRKSEWAGNYIASKFMYYFNRVLLGISISLISLLSIFEGELQVYIYLIMISVLGIFIYDLIVFKKIGNIKYFLKSLVFFALIYVLLLGCRVVTRKYFDEYKYDFNKIKSFSFFSTKSNAIMCDKDDDVKKILAKILNTSRSDNMTMEKIYIKYGSLIISTKIDYDEFSELLDYCEKSQNKIELPEPKYVKTSFVNEYGEAVCEKYYKKYYEEFMSLTVEQQKELLEKKYNGLFIEIGYYENMNVKYLYLPFDGRIMPRFTKFYVDLYIEAHEDSYKKAKEFFDNNSDEKVLVLKRTGNTKILKDYDTVRSILKDYKNMESGDLYHLYGSFKNILIMSDKEIECIDRK